MQCTTIVRFLILGLLMVCAGALAGPDGDLLSPGPRTTLPTQAAVSGDSWYGLLRRNMDQMLEKRGEAGIRTEADVKGLDMESWSRDTVRVCAEKLNSTAVAVTNPAGVAGCWNLPVLIAGSGVFAADLRLFRVAEPTGDWVDVDSAAYNISLEYDGTAAIQSRNMTAKEMKASKEGMPIDTTITRLIDAQFIGNINKVMLTKGITDTKLMAMVTPKISIKAFTKSGKKVSTTINIAGSMYLNGVFAVASGLGGQAATVKATPFELPGTRIEIIPAGLYFYTAYLVVACSIFGWGTLERAKFRDQYRERIATHGYR